MRRAWQPTPVFLPGESHGQSSLAGCSPWGHKESDTTQWLSMHASMLLYNCLESLVINKTFSSVQSLSRFRLFATPWIAARQASLSITNTWSSPKLMSIKSVMPSSHLILCRPLLLLPPIPPSIRPPRSQLFTWGGQYALRNFQIFCIVIIMISITVHNTVLYITPF